jgi:DnaJ-domain-containing protein 1
LAYGAIFLTSLCSVVPLLVVTSNGVWESIPNQGSALRESESRVTEFAEAPEVADFEPDDHVQDEDTDEDKANCQSPYEVLEVKPTATRDEIMTAYRKLVRQYHPDYLQERGDELKQLADRKMKEINLAKDEALRAL